MVRRLTELSDDEIAAYDAPFPDETFKEGARIFPSLVPTSADDPAVPANHGSVERVHDVGQTVHQLLQRQ